MSLKGATSGLRPWMGDIYKAYAKAMESEEDEDSWLHAI